MQVRNAASIRRYWPVADSLHTAHYVYLVVRLVKMGQNGQSRGQNARCRSFDLSESFPMIHAVGEAVAVRVGERVAERREHDTIQSINSIN